MDVYKLQINGQWPDSSSLAGAGASVQVHGPGPPTEAGGGPAQPPLLHWVGGQLWLHLRCLHGLQAVWDHCPATTPAYAQNFMSLVAKCPGIQCIAGHFAIVYLYSWAFCYCIPGNFATKDMKFCAYAGAVAGQCMNSKQHMSTKYTSRCCLLFMHLNSIASHYPTV